MPDRHAKHRRTIRFPEHLKISGLHAPVGRPQFRHQLGLQAKRQPPARHAARIMVHLRAMSSCMLRAISMNANKYLCLISIGHLCAKGQPVGCNVSRPRGKTSCSLSYSRSASSFTMASTTSHSRTAPAQAPGSTGPEWPGSMTVLILSPSLIVALTVLVTQGIPALACPKTPHPERLPRSLFCAAPYPLPSAACAAAPQ